MLPQRRQLTVCCARFKQHRDNDDIAFRRGMNQVHLQRGMLAMQGMLTGGVKVELLEVRNNSRQLYGIEVIDKVGLQRMAVVYQQRRAFAVVAAKRREVSSDDIININW